ncbi:MAG: LamG-like jellyroll fold domain-containing protein, partial [Flavisolibacter sp.]
GTAVSGDMAIATSGSYDVDLSYAAQTYYFKQSAYDGRVTAKSSDIVVKAFTLPKTATAAYDTNTHKATFTWTMDSVTSPSNYVNDKFKIQVSPDASFSSGATVYIDYYLGQKSYTYTVDKNFSPTLYFRVARNHTGFEWELAQVTQVGITFNALLTAYVELQNNNTGYINWTVRPSAWLPGCSFIIKRTNTTTNAQTQFSLGESDYYAGHYSDAQIAICNQYTYSLQVQPPTNSDFTAHSAIQTGYILPSQTGIVSNLAVSKGYFPDRVELTWTGSGTFDNFIIKRAPYGSSTFVQLAKIPGATSGDFSIDDSTGTPGTYYTYMVIGTGTCNNHTVYSDTLRAVGFRSPTGNVYGRVTYESGQAVENVAVRMQSNDQAQLGQSVYLNGNTNSYLKLQSLKTSFEDSALTVEAWIKPDDSIPTSQVLFSRAGQYEFGFNTSGKLYFTYKDTTTTAGNYTICGNYFNPNKTFVHVAAIHRPDSMFLLLNDSVIAKSSASYSASSPQPSVYIGSRAGTSRNYKGYIDEIRVWNVALSTATVARDYTRLLSGGETGLAAYWRLDETIVDQFYDASHHGDQYNQNDGSMNWLQVERRKTIPAAEQLGLKDFTDGSGNYMITGIPFVGNGTTYTIAPLLGTHQFDPTSANRLISTASPVFTLDFKDKSSFNVIGTVKYKNSTVPVSGVQFKIDGKLAQQSNGAIIQTDVEGKFAISVPIGIHEVQAVKNNHVFVNDGKITDVNGYNLDYQKDLPTIDLRDSTSIRFIGRVAGGPIQEALPLGHSVSVNNLGRNLSITLKLPSDEKYELRSRDTVVTNLHFMPSNRTDSGKLAKTVVSYQLHQIVISPDSTTGEFIVDLIPEMFKAVDVSAAHWGNMLSSDIMMDFTNKFSVQASIRDYVDSSTTNSQGELIKTNFSDTVFYNTSYKFIRREKPSVALEQLDFSGNPLPYFGNDTYQTLTFAGGQETVKVVDTSYHNTQQMYVFGWPGFIQNQPYSFRIKAFEAYPYYIDDTHIKQKNNKDVIDYVPTQDGKVSVYNNLRNGSSATPDTLSLNADGIGIYQFIAGDPDLTGGKKDFAATIRFGQSTYVSWKWYDSLKMKAYLLGGKLTGTDFVTAGPDKVLFVLRDPPGSKSFSSVEQGSKITTSSKYTGNIKNEGDEEFTTQLGYELITFTGIGVGVINRVDTKTGIGFGIHHEEHYTGSDTKENSTELTTSFKTSDDPLFVGPPADVFVGYSTNITYGKSNNITIIKKQEFKPTDVAIYTPDPPIEHMVVLRAGINIGEVFGTLFAYPQQHIQNILIPNLLNIRNDQLLPKSTSATDAQTRADSRNEPVYVSKLEANDERWGKSNSDTVAFGSGAKSTPFGDGDSYKIYFPTGSTYRTDTILVLNQYVASWQKRMADNEKAKLEAALVQNYSYHSGAPIEYSEETVVKKEHEDEFSFVIGGSVTNSTDFEALGSGFEFKFKEDITTEHGGTFVSSTENTMKYGFTLASEGTDDYFSVDVSKAADSAFVFRTKGGSSGCPYAGLNTTKYYQPGTIIDQPTLRNEVPVISVVNPVANNVPTARKASFTLLLKNESEAKLSEAYMLTYVNTDSIKGATIAVDGLSIADGRTIPVQYGETIQKVLTIERGPEAMNYNDIMILWRSPCQYDPTGYRENIADTVLVSAHFIPSCSDIAIKEPKDKWVLNTLSDTDAQHRRFLPIKIDQFDVSGLFHHIELQYKSSTKSTWTTVMKFYYVSIKFKAAHDPQSMFTDASAIDYNFVMDDANFNDQAYDIQAVAYCDPGGNQLVSTESNMVSGIKDTYSPRLFGSPQPANGILTVNDDVRLNFNETIAAGLMTNNNFQVTGIRNGAPTNHNVSVNLDGAANYLATEFEKSFAGKNITAEMWVNPSVNPPSGDQTIFSHGDASSSLELALTSANVLKVTVGGTSFTGGAALTPGQWYHVALVYNDNSKTISVFRNWNIAIGPSTVNAYTGTGHIEYGRSIVAQNKWFKGKIHEARIWSDTLSGMKLQLNALKILSGTESNLLAYYPMNEGKGNVVLDKANGSNAALNGQWTTPPSNAVHLAGNDR